MCVCINNISGGGTVPVIAGMEYEVSRGGFSATTSGGFSSPSSGALASSSCASSSGLSSSSSDDHGIM